MGVTVTENEIAPSIARVFVVATYRILPFVIG